MLSFFVACYVKKKLYFCILEKEKMTAEQKYYANTFLAVNLTLIYCTENVRSSMVVRYIDPTGMKDTTFVVGKDKPISEKAGTATPLYDSNGNVSPNAKDAYNCHSYAWDNSQGDPKDPNNAYPVSIGATKWDNDPSNNMGGYTQLGSNDPNQKGDRVIYYIDKNGNGKYDAGENIEHSAIVQTVDKNGNTTTVIGKMGQAGISENHPTAPNYYNTDSNNNPTSRAYFRRSSSAPASSSSSSLPVLKIEPNVAVRNATYVAPSVKIQKIPIRK